MFCGKCGEPLEHYYSPFGYSKKTGELLYRLRLRCPRARWWNRHDNYINTRGHHCYEYKLEYTMQEINHFLAAHKEVMFQIDGA